jgi:hypothetical protein
VSQTELLALPPSLCVPVLCDMVEDNAPALLVGPPGVAKTSMVLQVQTILQCDIIVTHPVVLNPTDVKGLGFADWEREIAKFLPFGDLLRAKKATRKTIWFIDDLGQAPAAVQAAFMQLILARRIGEHEISEHVTFVCATNRRQDRAGVKEFLNPLKSRMVTIIQVVPTVEDWCAWAYENAMPPALIALIRSQGIGMLIDENPSPEIENSRNPRSWENAGRVLRNNGYVKRIPEGTTYDRWEENPEDPTKKMKVSVDARRHVLHANLQGAVGVRGAAELLNFFDFSSKLPDPQTALAAAKTYPLPVEGDPGMLLVFAIGMAQVVTESTLGLFLTLAERIASEANRGEVAGLMLKDAFAIRPKLRESSEYVSRVVLAEGSVLQELEAA